MVETSQSQIQDLKIDIEKPNLVAIVRVDNYDSQKVRQGIQRLLELLNPSFLHENLNNKTILLKPNVLAPDKMAFSSDALVKSAASIWA